MRAPVELTQDITTNRAWERVKELINDIGFEFCVYCYVDASNINAFKAITTENALAWGRYHLEKGYSEYDPVIKSVHNNSIFLWNSYKVKDSFTRKIMNERRDFGMKGGLTIPIYNRFNQLTSWLSLSTGTSQKSFEDIIMAPNFTDSVYDVHFKTVSHRLSDMTGVDFSICYAIVLSTYINNLEDISYKTGILLNDLSRLFSFMYLHGISVNFFSLDLDGMTIEKIKALSDLYKCGILNSYKLSPRQLDCVRLVKQGLTAKQAAKMLGISPRTYEGYINEVRLKLNCANQKQLILLLS